MYEMFLWPITVCFICSPKSWVAASNIF